MARILALNSSVFVQVQYWFQQSRYPEPAQPAPASSPGALAGILLEWQRAQRSAKTSLPRVSLALSLVKYAAPPGASSSLCGALGFRKNRAMAGVCAAVAPQ